MRCRNRIIALIGGVALTLAGASHADATVFAIDRTLQNLTVAGSITTDGTPGKLVASNIDSWNLNVTVSGSGGLPPLALTYNNSTLGLVGTALSETATQLTFDFSAAGSFQFENSTAAWCLVGTAAGTCQAGGATTNGSQFEGAYFIVPTIVTAFGGAINQTGAQVIGSSSVPEPPSLVLLGLAVTVLGLSRSSRRVIGLVRRRVPG